MDEEERKAGQIKNKSMAVPFCCRGVWHTYPGPDMSSEQREIRLREIIDKNRKDDCFFIEYYEGMTFSTAENFTAQGLKIYSSREAIDIPCGVDYCRHRPCDRCLFSGCEFLFQMKGRFSAWSTR